MALARMIIKKAYKDKKIPPAQNSEEASPEYWAGWAPADLSGVKLRSIQMYEQKSNDIDKAQARTLYKISRVLGCNIEDILENPMK